MHAPYEKLLATVQYRLHGSYSYANIIYSSNLSFKTSTLNYVLHLFKPHSPVV